MQFPPIGGGEAATWGGAAPTVQTTSAKNGENGRLWARSWQLGPSTGSLNPSMRSYTHLVEAGRRRPRSTRWVNMRIKGPKHPPAGPRPPPIGLTCASKGFTCAGCIHRNRRGPDAHRRPDDPHASPETTEAGPRRIPPLVACDGRTVRTEKSRSQQHVVSLNPESPGSTVGSTVESTVKRGEPANPARPASSIVWNA